MPDTRYMTMTTATTTTNANANGDGDAKLPSVVRSANFRRQVRRLLDIDRPRLRRLWAYYANPMRPCAVAPDDAGSGRPYRLAQEWGMPSRITGSRVCAVNGPAVDASSPLSDPLVAQDIPGVSRKEVVIENDIGWRIDTLVVVLANVATSLHDGDPSLKVELKSDWGGVWLTVTAPLIIALVRLILARRRRRITPRRSASARSSRSSARAARG